MRVPTQIWSRASSEERRYQDPFIKPVVGAELAPNRPASAQRHDVSSEPPPSGAYRRGKCHHGLDHCRSPTSANVPFIFQLVNFDKQPLAAGAGRGRPAYDFGGHHRRAARRSQTWPRQNRTAYSQQRSRGVQPAPNGRSVLPLRGDDRRRPVQAGCVSVRHGLANDLDGASVDL